LGFAKSVCGVGVGEDTGPLLVTGPETGSMGFSLVGVDPGPGLFPTVVGGLAPVGRGGGVGVPTGYVGGWARWICFTITVLPHAGVINPASVLCAGFEPTASSIGFTIVVLSATIIVSSVLFRITLCLSLSLRESKHRANQRGRYKGTCDQGAQSKTIKSLHVDYRCTVPNLARGYARPFRAPRIFGAMDSRTARHL